MKNQKPFRDRAKKVIHKAVNLRIFLIESGKSKNAITLSICQKILQDIDVLRSDRQLAVFVKDNYTLLEKIMPGPDKKNKAVLNDLLNESSKHI